MKPLDSNQVVISGEKILFSVSQKTIFIFSICLMIISCTGKPFKKVEDDLVKVLSFQYHVVDADGVHNPWAKMIADINGDGALDIIIGGQKGPLVWYKNPEWEKFDIADGGYDTVDGEAGDIDGDGDMDIVMGGLFWYENPGRSQVTTETSWTAHKIADHATHDVELADINKDGSLDVITRNQSEFGTEKGNTIHVWVNRGNGKWDEDILECEHGEGLKVIDLEGDGDKDVIGSGFWFENLGNEDWKKHHITAWHASANLAVADVNGDNRKDIVLTPSELGGQYYKISWFEQPEEISSGRWKEHYLVDSIECVIHGVGVGDFNGDNAMDVAYSEMHQGQDPDEVVVLINLDYGTSWGKIILSEKGSHSIEVADINGDGNPDILGANWSGDYQPVEIWFSRK